MKESIKGLKISIKSSSISEEDIISYSKMTSRKIEFIEAGREKRIQEQGDRKVLKKSFTFRTTYKGIVEYLNLLEQKDELLRCQKLQLKSIDNSNGEIIARMDLSKPIR